MNRSIVAAVIFVSVCGFMSGCNGSTSGGNNNNINLTQAQAQQVSKEVYTDISSALASALSSSTVPLDISSRDHIRAALLRNRQTDTASKPEDISCSTAGTCTVSGTYPCLDGGSIAVSGNFNVTSTSANISFTDTPSNCSDGTLIINGNPDITVDSQVNNDGVTATVNFTIGGGVDFSPVQAGKFPAGSCSCNLTANTTLNDSTGSLTACSITGSICGQTINVNCSTP